MRIQRLISTKHKDPMEWRQELIKRFPNITELHNHTNSPNRYPLMQFKNIGNMCALINISCNEINLNSDEAMSLIEEENIEITKEMHTYRFIQPYTPFKSDKFKLYKEGKITGSDMILKHVTALCKEVGDCCMEETITVDNINLFETTSCKIKDIIMVSYTGSFECNINIPNHLGIGKFTSKGYGTLLKIK